MATADSSAKDSKDAAVQDKLNEVRARASAKKGNKEIIYDEKPEKSHLKGFCGEKGASFAYSDGKKVLMSLILTLILMLLTLNRKVVYITLTRLSINSTN